MRSELQSKIFSVTPQTFNGVALEVCRYQYRHSPLYRSFADLLDCDIGSLSDFSQIPHLPIAFFKNHNIKTGDYTEEVTFSSSGTTGSVPSLHHVRDLDWYDRVSLALFEEAYGSIGGWRVLALLPAYLERQGSSLVRMAERFIYHSGHPQSGFFLHDMDALARVLATPYEGKTLLLGVSFALWDLAERHPMSLRDTIVMETGGMKGRRPEITREHLHDILRHAFAQSHIHSEYGMTELLSQAYSKGDGIFRAGRTMRVSLRQVTDPFAKPLPGRAGLINVTDLANLDSCAFIATDDLGKLLPNGAFEVLGRLDHSDVRGCNLMAL